jgi:hypothetical protein
LSSSRAPNKEAKEFSDEGNLVEKSFFSNKVFSKNKEKVATTAAG